jgi:hypothetical protein
VGWSGVTYVMRKVERFAAALGMMALAACTTSVAVLTGSVAASSKNVTANQNFSITPGQSAHVDGGRLTVSFVGVTEDSRCPTGVQCVWAGNAAVSLVITSADGARSAVSLNTTLDPRSVIFGGYEVALIQLDPNPRQGQPIPQASYLATLRAATIPR